MKLLVVILSYKVTDLTIDCLRSLAGEIGRVPGARVAVCENGTGGDAEQRLREAIDANGWGDWCDLSAIWPNRGFTGGNNYVIRKALASADPPEYVLLLNADTIVREHALDTLVEFMDGHPQVGVAGSRLDWPDGTPQGSPFRFFNIATEFDRGLKLGLVSRLLARWAAPPEKPAAPAPVDWVSGASMVIRRQTLEEVGLLDESLYTYFDDIDYCLRARRAGWATWYVPVSRITHLEGMSTGITKAVVKRRPAYWFQARRRFFLKNHGGLYTALVDAAFLVGFAVWRLRRRLQGKPDSDPPGMLGDSVRHSVFATGFNMTEVENPAMADRGGGPSINAPAPGDAGGLRTQNSVLCM